MKKNELENRLSEGNEIRDAVQKTMQASIDEQKRAEKSSEDVIKFLTDVMSFSKESLEAASKVPEGERLKFYETTLQKLIGWSTSEADRIKLRPIVLQERVAALQSVNGWLLERLKSHEARIAAIERAADPARDKRHPEKLSVRRAAESQEEE